MRASRRGFLSGGPTTLSLTARPSGTSARQSLVAPDQSAGPATREPSPARQLLVTGRSGRAPGGLPPAPRKALSARLTRRLLGSADRSIRGPAVGPVVGGMASHSRTSGPRHGPGVFMSHVGPTPGPGQKEPVSAPPKTVSPQGARWRHSPPGPRNTPAAPAGHPHSFARATGSLPRPQAGFSSPGPRDHSCGPSRAFPGQYPPARRAPLPPKAWHWPGPGARCRL